MSGRRDQRIGRSLATSALGLGSVGASPTEIIRHAPPQDVDVPRVLHVWGSPGQWAATRPFINGILQQEANGITRVERIEIPWSGLAVQLLEGEVTLNVSVANIVALPDGATVSATISPGYCTEGTRLCLRVDSQTGGIVIDPEDPNFGCPFSTSLIVSGHGAVLPFTISYPGALVVFGNDTQTLEVDVRPKVTVTPQAGCSVSLVWRFFR